MEIQRIWALSKQGEDVYGLFPADTDGAHYGHRIAEIKGEANAALIRLAPEMAELLAEIVDSDMAQREEDEGGTSDLLDSARELLARLIA